jgi:protein-disulfide isomerase
MNKKIVTVAISLVVLIGLFFLAKTFYQDRTQEKIDFLANQDSSIFVRDHSPRYGNPEAKVYLIEFLDPECESCRAFYPIVKQLLNQYKDKVQLVVRYAPFHHNSVIAIRALEAARMQNMYWESLELLFEKQPLWGDHQNPRPEDLIWSNCALICWIRVSKP